MFCHHMRGVALLTQLGPSLTQFFGLNFLARTAGIRRRVRSKCLQQLFGFAATATSSLGGGIHGDRQLCAFGGFCDPSPLWLWALFSPPLSNNPGRGTLAVVLVLPVVLVLLRVPQPLPLLVVGFVATVDCGPLTAFVVDSVPLTAFVFLRLLAFVVTTTFGIIFVFISRHYI
ncbi:expressed unknown protein [Seminavis robusta]|uniref:Uncharacterized protein n=1 Tax=Seminavis robusta TaxID=568900 RepID=A0A9N8ED01_9STRA|nr:expressed unknown protein [Seminavis robusta]|eukprot:Sro942_g222732.1  (173) ;mRNA; f:39408-39926